MAWILIFVCAFYFFLTTDGLEEALATADVEKRREIVKRGEAMIQEEGVTIQPYWRSLYNHTKEGLVGGAHHIAFEIRPAELAWT